MIRRWLRERREQRRAMRRAADLTYLWPALKRRTPTKFQAAYLAFTLHASIDPAWRGTSTDEVIETLRKWEGVGG